MRCISCGRLLGLRSRVECPCFRAQNKNAKLPQRISATTHRVQIAFRAAAQAKTEQARYLADMTFRQLNAEL